MSLFNKRILKKSIGNPAPIPSAHLEILSNWARTINDRSIFSENETQIEGDFKSRIIEAVLGYIPAGLEAPQTVAVQELIAGGRVDLALGSFGDDRRIIAPFELKGAKTRDLDAPISGRRETPVEQAWRYARKNSGTKWVLVSNYLEIRLYSYALGEQEYEAFFLKDLTDPDEYARFRLLLSAENLLSGNTQTLLDESGRADKEIGEALYREYRTLRETLIAVIPVKNSSIDAVTAVGAAQKILDRILFVAFAEDTGLLPARSLEQAYQHADPYNPRPVWQNFLSLFRAVDEGNKGLNIPKYNGGLFQPDPAVDEIELPDEICEGFKRIGSYDFETEVGVTILGRIFEQSVSDLERLLARARGDAEDDSDKTGATGRRKRDGIVYTPDYIARFIVERTLGTHINEIFRATMAKHARGDADDYDNLQFAQNSERGKATWNKRELEAWTEFRFKLQTLRVVDPACGSGVFLVTAFDYLKSEYDKVNAKMAELRGSPDLFDPDAEILSQNLYGVDVNAESVEITKLSLWLKTAKKGKELASLDHTIRVGDSLIEDSNFAYLEHGFTWQKAFPEVFANGGFDVVLGNPPYVRQELLSPLKPYLQKRFEVYHGVADLYCYFFERGLRLLKPGGRLGYISSSTFFKTNSGKPLRAYLPNAATLETITDFGDLQIFDGVTTYPAILTMQRREMPKDHALHFWKLDEIPRENFSKSFDAHAENFPQDALTQASWQLENPALRALRTKIVEGKQTLKQVYGSPYRGVLTGRNEAFVIDRQVRDRLVTEDPKSEEILKPVLKGNELKRWRIEPEDLWLILFPKGWTGQNVMTDNEETAWNWLTEQYPAIAGWLLPFAAVCRKRTDKGNFWWELRACDYYEQFKKPKISYIEICSWAPFSFDDKQRYQEATTFFIPAADRFLLALLNSNPIWFFWAATTSFLRGGYQRMKNQYVEPVPIPPAFDTDKAALARLAEACQLAAEARYEKQEALRRRIPDLCPPDRDPKLNTKLKNWWVLDDFRVFRAEVKKHFKADIPLAERTDWETWFTRERGEIARLSSEIARFEADINKIVYRLFDLTSDEITLLEANI